MEYLMPVGWFRNPAPVEIYIYIAYVYSIYIYNIHIIYETPIKTGIFAISTAAGFLNHQKALQ